MERWNNGVASSGKFINFGSNGIKYGKVLQEFCDHICNNKLNHHTAYEKIDSSPNPASADINIELQLKETGLLSIKLFDLTGNICHEEEHDIHQIGSQIIRVNPEGPTPGIYILEIKHGNFVEREKIVFTQ